MPVYLFPALLIAATVAVQGPSEQTLRDLASTDPGQRLRAVQQLKEAAVLEAAVPLARLVTDPRDDIQREAIAAELNIFLAERVVPQRHIGFVVEVRNQIVPEAVFAAGPLALGPRAVPAEVLSALRTAARDDDPDVRLEALYAWGALGIEPGGRVRRDLLGASGPDVAAMIGARDVATRFAAVRVLGRVFEWRPGDPPLEQTIGDALVTALNDRDPAVRAAAADALGALRYDRAVGALTERFQYFEKGVEAEAALDAIARIAHPSSAEVLAMQLGSKSAALKAIAMEGTARMGDRERVPAVQAALAGERNDRVLVAGSFAIVALSGGSIQPLVDVLRIPKLRGQAEAYLADLAIWRSAAFAPYVKDADPRVRASLVDAIGLGGDPAALPLVEPLVGDADEQVARAAARAVARLRSADER